MSPSKTEDFLIFFTWKVDYSREWHHFYEVTCLRSPWEPDASRCLLPDASCQKIRGFWEISFLHEWGLEWRSRADIWCIRLRIVSRNFFIFKKRDEFADKASQVADSRFPSCRFQVFIGLASFRSLFQGFWSNKTGKMYISTRSTILKFRILFFHVFFLNRFYIIPI